MVLEKLDLQAVWLFQAQKEEFDDELDYDLKLDGTFRPEGILATVNSCGIFRFPSGTFNLLFVQSTPKGFTCS